MTFEVAATDGTQRLVIEADTWIEALKLARYANHNGDVIIAPTERWRAPQ